MNKNENMEIISSREKMAGGLFSDLIYIIEQRKQIAFKQANSNIVLMFWEIGKRINDEILKNERAEYGKQISVTVSHQLMIKYGNSFEYTNLTRMMKFARDFIEKEIVVTVSQQLGWSHILAILPLKTMEAKLYYAEETSKHNLGVRDLRHIISRKVYERKDIANLNLSSQSKVLFNVFKDPYLLDMFDLKENFLEADLEKAIIKELEKFILEFGQNFSFISRQKRLTYNGKDYIVDLLFFNRDLRRLVAIELKLGEFKTEYKGQMEMYLRLLNEFERKEWEDQPIGIILCTEANRKVVEFLEMDKVGIVVAEFWTKLPSKEQFEEKLQDIVIEANERLVRSKIKGGSTSSKQLEYFIEPKPEDYPDED